MTTHQPLLLPRDAGALALAARDAALCTLVGIDGSFSRSLGAQFAVAPDGSRSGDMADACLDRALADECAQAAQDGASRLVRYGQGSPFIDIRLPCGGGLDILVDPAPDRAVCQDAIGALAAREPVTLGLPLGRQAGPMQRLDWQAGDSSRRDEGAGQFRRVYHPALRVHVFGAGPEVAALTRLAPACGIDPIVHMPASDGSSGTLFMGRAPQDVRVDPWTAIILLFHDHDWELPILDWALGTEAFFIGALGSQRTADTRREAMRSAGRSEADLARVRGPIGAFGPAKDPDTLALSVLAEIVPHYQALA